MRGLMSFLKYLLGYCLLAAAFFCIEFFTYYLLDPQDQLGLWFGLMWALILSAFIFVFPKIISKILFAIVYFLLALWAIAQVGYYQVFGKMMWFSTVFFADEGATFFTDVVSSFSTNWWIGGVLLLGIGGLVLGIYPKTPKKFWKLTVLIPVIAGIITLSKLPETIYARDEGVWGTKSEYEQVSSSRAAYDTMYDAGRVYKMCGIYHLTWRDLWINYLYPLSPAYQQQLQQEHAQIDAFFEGRPAHEDNEMTGIFEGKNVVFVLMESMDDYMITPQDTPTIHSMMKSSIVFTEFYAPGYGSARTLNSEFCVNTGIYLPTTGKYVFDYITNDYSQSIASKLGQTGYSSYVFHYNTPKFYSRGVFEPAMGYNSYVSYEDYTQDKDALYDDQLLFDLPETQELFFREGPTFNTVITRSAHLSYKYLEVLSYWGLKKYPDYRDKYPSEEESCARLKARLVDDFFTRLLQELEARDQLENTVIVAVTDHYTYGYKNTEELLQLSGVTDPLLLEKVPCFIWSYGSDQLLVDKTLNTSDLLPTVMNLMGMDATHYLGQDAFDPGYAGYVIFPDGTWITNGIVSTSSTLSQEETKRMNDLATTYIQVSNLLLTSDYYKK